MSVELIRAATYIHAPYETVWKTLTRPERQAEWHVATCLAFGWEPGAYLAWGQRNWPMIEGKLQVWAPATFFSHSFTFTTLEEPESLVEWELMPLGEVVWLEIKHLFTEEAPESQAIVTDGWPLVLARLKTLLETGAEMPWPEYETEESSPES